VVTDARLGGIDDLRKECRQSEYAGREPHGQLRRSGERHASLHLCWHLERRGTDPRMYAYDFVATGPRTAGERDELGETRDDTEGEEEREDAADEAVAAGPGWLDGVTTWNAKDALDKPGSSKAKAAHDQQCESRDARGRRRR